MKVPKILWLLLFAGSRSKALVLDDCCEAQDEEELYLCTQSQVPTASSGVSRRSLQLVSYSTPNVLGYAAYSFALMHAYAQQRNYRLSLHSPGSGDEHEPSDQRWNRVKILSNLLDPTKLHASLDHGDSPPLYYVWFDADLIFLDWTNMDLERLIATHSDKDIIISAERHAGTGIANTGCFIVKNTEWSRHFLDRWWNDFDRTQAHDQIFFDKLYRSLDPERRLAHIIVLPTTELNSTPPPMLYQTPSDRVLHLMGESIELRSQAFKVAWQNICRVHHQQPSGAIALPAQLGLTQPVLLEMAISTWERELSHVMNRLNPYSCARKSSSQSAECAPVSWQELHLLIPRARESMLQLGKLGSSSSRFADNVGGLNTLRTLHRLSLRELSQAVSISASTSTSTSAPVSTSVSASGESSESSESNESRAKESLGILRKVEALNLCGTTGQDLAQALQLQLHSLLLSDPESAVEVTKSTRATYQQVEVCLRDLLAAVAPVSRPLVREMIAMHASSWGSFEMHLGDGRNVALAAFRRAIQALGPLELDKAELNLHHAVPVFFGMSQTLCLTTGANALEVAEGLETFKRVVRLQDSLLQADLQWKQDHAQLAELLVHGAICALEARQANLAREWYARVEKISVGHPQWDQIQVELKGPLQVLRERLSKLPPGSVRKVIYRRRKKNPNL